MKIIITESQYKNIILGDIPPFIRRRLEELDDMVIDEEINQPTLCDDFLSSDEYANYILKEVIIDFIGTYSSKFPESMDTRNRYGLSLKKILYEKHYDRLVKVYNDTCIEYNS